MIRNGLLLLKVLLTIKGLLKVTRFSESRGEEVTISKTHPYWAINALKKTLNSVPANNYEQFIENDEIRALCLVIIMAQKSDIRKGEQNVSLIERSI